jgi:hypothetical protein
MAIQYDRNPLRNGKPEGKSLYQKLKEYWREK